MGDAVSKITRAGLDAMSFGSYEAMRKVTPDALTPDQVAGRLYTTPGMPPPMPQAPDPTDEAVRNARLMERRRQLGLSGRMSTFLTTAQGEGGDSQPKATSTPTSTLLGG